MKKRICVIFLSLILLPFVALFTACGGGGEENANKQTPIYQGMTVTSADETSAVSYSQSVRAISRDDDDEDDWFDFDEDDWHGHFRPGEHHGDKEGKDEDIDQQDPYPSEPGIEEKISSLEVVGGAKNIYYTEKNTDVYVCIKLLNPDKFEIVSLVFNGEKYTSYMFASGSDLENIYIKVSIPNVTGIVEYTVDEIKYIDGSEIKDVIVNADKTVRIGIKDGDMVQALVSQPAAHLSSFNMNVQVVDNYDLLEYSNSKLKAYLYNGETILQQKDLEVGNQSVEFTGLTPNTLYQVAVAGVYDDLGGTGRALHVLYQYAFYTDSLVLFSEPTITQTSIEWNYVWNQEIQDQSFESVELYLDNNKIESLDVAATKVEDLYSDRIYTVKATYKNLKGENESIYLHAMTQKKDVPTFVINDLVASKTDVQFTFSKTDVDNVATVNKINLLKNGVEVQTITENFDGTLSFNGILSNTDYVIELEYTYNLNDGKDVTTTTAIKAFKTQAKAEATFEISTPVASKTNVEFSFVETDADNIATINKINLLKNGAEIQSITENFDGTLSFNGLLSNTDYVIELEYTYNLNDGNGDITAKATKAFKTEAKIEPEITLSLKNRDTSTLEFEAEKSDPDNLFQFVEAELSGKDATYSVDSLDSLKFENLTSYTDYTLTVKYSYDLNDGNGTQYAEKTLTAKTEFELKVLSTSVSNNTAVSEGDSLYITLEFDNPAKARIMSAKVNGIDYEASWSAFKPNEATITILYNDQFEGGDTTLTVNSITAEIDGMTQEITLNNNNTGSVFINGRLEILDAEFRDMEGNPLKDIYLVSNQDYYIYIKLYNPTGYTVTSLTYYLWGNNLIEADIQNNLEPVENSYIRFKTRIGSRVGVFEHLAQLRIYEITYKGKFLPSKKQNGDFVDSTIYVAIENDNITHIQTADQLKQMDGGEIYILDNDIDLKGEVWTPGAFSGIFDGQGFAIKNFLASGTFDTYKSFGLFSSAYGKIQDLSLENFKYQVTCKNPTGSDGSALSIGTISGGYGSLLVENCTIDMSVILNALDNFASDTLRVSYAADNAILHNCKINCSINVSGQFPSIDNEIVVECEVHLNCDKVEYLGYTGSLFSKYTNCAIYIYNFNPWNRDGWGPENTFIFHIQNKSIEYYLDNYEQIYGSTLAEKVAQVKELWDNDIWDFEHLDNYGNPTLKNLPKPKAE